MSIYESWDEAAEGAKDVAAGAAEKAGEVAEEAATPSEESETETEPASPSETMEEDSSDESEDSGFFLSNVDGEEEAEPDVEAEDSGIVVLLAVVVLFYLFGQNRGGR